MPAGEVKFYDAKKGFGYIASNEVPQDVHVARQDITPVSVSALPGLYNGQEVIFDVRQTSPDRYSAFNVSSSSKRVGGKVLEFAGEGGSIELDDRSRAVPVKHADIDWGRRGAYKSLVRGELVELEIDSGGSARHVVRLDPRPALFRFAEETSLTLGKLEHLAKVAEHEGGPNFEGGWDYLEQPTGDLPILSYYIHKTFEQLALQKDGLLYDEQTPELSSRACFNTGLVTDLQQEILGVFEKNPRRGATPWTPSWSLEGFFVSSDRRLSSFSHTEFPLATYFTSVTELFLDRNMRVERSLEHIIGDKRVLDRFPARLQRPDDARGALERALNDAMRRVARNYKTAVPQFYHGQIHLLLPLALDDPKKVDRAAVLRKENKILKVATIYYLDWAYREARVLAKPDKEWLHPVRTYPSDENGDDDMDTVNQTDREQTQLDTLAGDEIKLRIGEIVRGRVTRIVNFGAFVELPGGNNGLCHISKITDEFVSRVSDHLREGDELDVKILSIKPDGKIDLSIRDAK